MKNLGNIALVLFLLLIGIGVYWYWNIETVKDIDTVKRPEALDKRKQEIDRKIELIDSIQESVAEHRQQETQRTKKHEEKFDSLISLDNISRDTAVARILYGVRTRSDTEAIFKERPRVAE